MKLTNNDTRAEISINETLTTTQLETLITQLATLRSKMQPEVSYAPPTPDKADSDLPLISVQSDPQFAIAQNRSGDFHLWLRNQGLGWLVFILPIDKACILRDYLNRTTSDKQITNLVSDDTTSRNRPQ